MQKDDALNVKSILMINALVKFNLIPPKDSEEWKRWEDRYESLCIHLFPLENFDSDNLKLIIELLSQSSIAQSPSAKFSLYSKICEITGFSIQQVACPVLHDYLTLKALCSYTLFKNPQPSQEPQPHLVAGIQAWCEFQDALPKFFLWDVHNDKELTSASTIAAAFCLELLSNLSDETLHSCLYGLAKILDREDYIQALGELNINVDHLPEKLKILYIHFLSTKAVSLENKHTQPAL